MQPNRKKFSFKYFFERESLRLRVCQQFFLNKLNISQARIYYFFNVVQNKVNVPRSPRTGRHIKHCISEDRLQEIRAHIESFPTVDSHYCRISTNKKYLERNLNMAKMFSLYKAKVQNPVSLSKFENIFNYEYNISFFKPKKDLCDKCEGYTMVDTPTSDQILECELHIASETATKTERDKDRKIQHSDKCKVLCFDMQKVFPLQIANVSSFYYKRKLNCYSVTAKVDNYPTVYNAIWYEGVCGREGTHIGNSLIKMIKHVLKDHPTTEMLTIWPDSCVPQNKNSIKAFAL